MNLLSLFAGIGGIDAGLERAGMTTVGQVELNPYCRQVLAKHWPEVPRHDDVRTAARWWNSEPRPVVDLVAGGFPCQPVSNAGQRRAQDDDRWLWDPMRDVVVDLGPEWVLFENVPGLRTRGLGTVLADLRDLGYRVRVGTLSACSLGAPHPRERLLGVAHAHSKGRGPGGGLRPAGPAAVGAGWWAREPGVGRMAHGVPGGVDRRRALGNAVVPAVAEYVGRLIVEANAASAAA